MFLERAGNPGIQTSALSYGTVIHYAIEVFEREWRTGTPWRQAKAIAVDTFKHYWHPMNIDAVSKPVELWLPQQSYGSLAARGVAAIEWYAEWARTEDEELLATEYGFQVPIPGTWDDDTDEPHILAGTIDRLSTKFYKRKPIVQVGDLKSGKDYPQLRQNLQFTSYCASPETPVLMADYTWKPLGKIQPGDQIVGFDEHTSTTRRRWHTATVTHSWSSRRNAFRITLSDGRELVASADHRWLPAPLKRGFQRAKKSEGWLRTDDLRLGDQLAAVFTPVAIDHGSRDYRDGYIAGVTLGDGCFRLAPGQPYWAVVKGEPDIEMFQRLQQYLSDLPRPLCPLWTREPNGRGGQKKPLLRLHTSTRANVEEIVTRLAPRDTDAWRAGWLAGLYDTDGGLHGTSHTVCIFQKDLDVLARVQEYGERLGLRFDIVERNGEEGCSCARLRGERMDRIRFFATTQPALTRKRESLDGSTVRIFDPVEVLDIEPLGITDLHDITTTTATFVANGILSHNCLATTRPEFWEGWRGEDGFRERGSELYGRFQSAARQGVWISLKHHKVQNAGWRGPDDYTRFALAVEQVVASIKADIYPMNISGENCSYCPHRDICAGVGVPKADHGAPV